MNIEVQERVNFLRARLLERDVTVEEVWDYIILQIPALNGVVQQNLADFVTEADLVAFWWLYDWWLPVQDKPTTLQQPTIVQFLWNVNHVPGAVPLTFNAACEQFYHRAVAYCQGPADIDVNNPGESKDERKDRRNRERMAKARGHKKVPKKKVEHDEILMGQVRGLEEQAEQLKQQMEEEDARLTEDVVGYQKRMQDAADERKASKADFKQRIDNIRAEIRSLIAKQ